MGRVLLAVGAVAVPRVDLAIGAKALEDFSAAGEFQNEAFVDFLPRASAEYGVED